MDELADLTSLQALRADLDRRELDLIDRARHTGATWAEIATALGLASRQAAEQRCQRLRTAARSLRHDHDLAYAHSIAPLRTAVLDLHRRIETDHGGRRRARCPVRPGSTGADGHPGRPAGSPAAGAASRDRHPATGRASRRTELNRRLTRQRELRRPRPLALVAGREDVSPTSLVFRESRVGAGRRPRSRRPTR
jgi:hypothetical protein